MLSLTLPFNKVIMKTVPVFAIFMAMALPLLSQSLSVSVSQLEEEQQPRTALDQTRGAIERYHVLFIRGKPWLRWGAKAIPPTSKSQIKQLTRIRTAE